MNGLAYEYFLQWLYQLRIPTFKGFQRYQHKLIARDDLPFHMFLCANLYSDVKIYKCRGIYGLREKQLHKTEQLRWFLCAYNENHTKIQQKKNMIV